MTSMNRPPASKVLLFVTVPSTNQRRAQKAIKAVNQEGWMVGVWDGQNFSFFFISFKILSFKILS